LPEGSREKLHRRWDAAFIHITDRKCLSGEQHGGEAHQQRAAQIAGQVIKARHHGDEGAFRDKPRDSALNYRLGCDFAPGMASRSPGFRPAPLCGTLPRRRIT
jgi:hypothetical protein